MKANKNNCHSTLFEQIGECMLDVYFSSELEKARVIEVPKVWRENGKQYVVTAIGSNGTCDCLKTVKAPRGVNVYILGSYSIEYYD